MAEFDIEAILAKLTIPQKITLLTGDGWWQASGVEEAGVPSIRMSDGPNGVRGSFFFNGTPSSCFPASTGLGSSFDIELAAKVGRALGDECRAKGCHVLLAPTVNTQRSPLGGRGFESFSEDPHLNGTIAAAYINGLQSKGIAATIKHFIANDQEFERFSVSSEVSERALREIYLKPFQIAIKKSKPWALMSSYNRLNGLHCSEHPRLLEDILRKEWGFEGTIISDWFGVYSTVESIKAGVDIEMPGPGSLRGKAVERAMMSGKLFPHDLDVRVKKILALIKRAKESGVPFNAPEETLDTAEVREVLRTAAADSVVLLKNDKKLLPLNANTAKTIAVIGPNAKYAMYSGGGSARLRASYTVSPLEGIITAAKEVGAETRYTFGVNCHQYLPLLDSLIKDAKLEFWNDVPSTDFLQHEPSSLLGSSIWETGVGSTHCFMLDNIDPKVQMNCHVRFSATFVPDESGDWELGLTVLPRGNLFLDDKLIVDLTTDPKRGDSFFNTGTTEERTVVKGLNAGQEYKLEVRLSNSTGEVSTFPSWGGLRIGGVPNASDEEGIAGAIKVAQEADVAILVIGLNHEYESETFDRQDMELPGLTNKLVQEVLKANPNTVIVNQSGTPVSMPWVEDAHTLVQAFYGGNELGNGLADVLFGKVNPSGKLPLTFPKRMEDSPSFPSFGFRTQEHGKVYYNEGIFVGYRGFDVKGIEPLFAFGHGLSYTSFEYSDLEVSTVSTEGSFDVTFKVKNTGEHQGREVIQIYVSDDQAILPRPEKELKGFAKVELGPGEVKQVTRSLDREAFCFYDERASHWIAEKGAFTVKVGAASDDIRLTVHTELKETITWTGL